MFALVDCNNFYVSCERVFQPRLQGIPVVVLSNNDACLISRSDEAKALGFKMGEPYHLVRQALQQHGAQVFSSNYALYGDMSRRVVQVMADFAPEVEVYSIDEAFLSLTGFEYLTMNQGLTAYADTIRQAIWQRVGIPTCVGVAPTKTLAKLANKLVRPVANFNVLVLETERQRRAALARTAIGDVWGIGRRYARKLQELGLATAADLAAMPEGWARRHLGGVVGQRLWHELHGRSCLDFDPAALEDDEDLPDSGRKSAACTRSFGRPQSGYPVLSEAVATFAGRAAGKLRRHGLAANLLTVLLGTSRHTAAAPGSPHTYTTVLRLPTATHDTGELVRFALRGLQRLVRPGVAYQRAGVVLSGLEPAGQTQFGLFAQTPEQVRRSQQLMETLDALNARFGKEKVHYAAAGTDSSSWAGRRALLSAAYTTAARPEELWQVRC